MPEPRNKPYKTREWKMIRAQVIKMDHGICQRCAGNYMPDPTKVRRRTKAVLVHHNFKLEEYPEWKYNIYVTINGEKVRNLWSLCASCHEEIHGDTHRRFKSDTEAFTTEERWD